MISDIVGYVRMFAFGFLFAGDMIVNALGGNRAPDILRDLNKAVQENKWQFGLMVFFVGSMI